MMPSTWVQWQVLSANCAQVCFIKTTNLDGESNLKVRRPVDLGEEAPESDAAVMRVRGVLQCEAPNANLHQFQGRFEVLTDHAGKQGQGSALCCSARCYYQFQSH